MKKSKIKLLGLAAILLLTGCSAAPKSTGTLEGTTAAEAIAETEAAEATEGALYEGEQQLDSANDEMRAPQAVAAGSGSEEYLDIVENKSIATDVNSLMTFSLKVDTAAYNNVERYISSGNLPPREAVKAEELINYFRYDSEMKFDGDSPFAVYTEVGQSPFDPAKQLAFVRVKSKDIDKEELPASNLTFLIDTSGSMDSHDKLPLLKSAFRLLVDNLTEDDTVSIVTYAGSSQVVLDSVSGADKDAILKAIDTLQAAGSTAGADGIGTAYKLAEKNLKKDGNNRIILATDGDFNVGVSSVDDLEKLVTEKRENGVYFSVLGFGSGNLKDDRMETLAKNSNGNYSYINSIESAKKVLVEEMSSNLFVVAHDVKAQIEFNPENIENYRLIGYENRILKNEDFEDDTKDAGEIGIGTDVVVLVELELKGAKTSAGLKYGNNETDQSDQAAGTFSDELMEVRIRYKDPGEDESKLLLYPIKNSDIRAENSSDFRFASAVAGFSQLLANSDYQGDFDFDEIYQTAEESLGADSSGYRYNFLGLLKDYQKIVD